ncbi:MAG: hypothetical protein O3C63_01240 [Cyanobacteria bacterium]|nr:hypothetical protein [Cyanobacteriota bacterium]MDA1021095.1 hypothetical protein [Cyanobacteriota bacterium]
MSDIAAVGLSAFLAVLFLGFLVLLLALCAYILFPPIKALLRRHISDERWATEQALETLRMIFLEYSHNNVDSWINWIKRQDEPKQQRAFYFLVEYLESDPSKVGSIVSEVIKAMTAFDSSESFIALNKLLERTRERWGAYSTAEQFYPILVLGLVELNEERAQSVLKLEFELLKVRDDTNAYLFAILAALSKIADNNDLASFYSDALVDTYCLKAVRQRIIEQLVKRTEEFKALVLNQTFKFYLNSSEELLDEIDVKTIQTIFDRHYKIITHDDYSVWDTVIKLCYHKTYSGFFTGLIAEFVESNCISISPRQLEQLFDSDCQTKSAFMQALIRRFEISEKEQERLKTMTRYNLIEEMQPIEAKKYSSLMTVPESMTSTFDAIARSLSLTKDFRNRARTGLSILTGGSRQDKIFILEALASRFDRGFIAVDFESSVYSVLDNFAIKKEINKFKPCLVYFYNFEKYYSQDLTEEGEDRVEAFNQLVNGYKLRTGIEIIVGVDFEMHELKSDNKLAARFNKVFLTEYEVLRNFVEPGDTDRQKIFTEIIEGFEASRLQSGCDLSRLIKNTSNLSEVEYHSYLQKYLRYSLLTRGSLVGPENFRNLPNTDIVEGEIVEASDYQVSFS